MKSSARGSLHNSTIFWKDVPLFVKSKDQTCDTCMVVHRPYATSNTEGFTPKYKVLCIKQDQMNLDL